MNWIHFNDNETKEGVEGRWYSPSPHRATFYIHGTNHREDWKSNFRTLGRARVRDGIKINKKDLREAQWVVELIRSKLDMNQLEILKLGGHSRGGAIASIVAWKIKEQFPHVSLQAILLAPKRTGNKEFVESIEPYTKAYRHRGDFVPFLPLWPRYRMVSLKTFGKFCLLSHARKSYVRFMDKYGLR